jgi:hypothetical protein
MVDPFVAMTDVIKDDLPSKFVKLCVTCLYKEAVDMCVKSFAA